MVNALSNQNITEGGALSVNCTATPGNPNSTTFYWTKEDDTGFRQDGATVQLHSIQRTGSGIYICTAENTYSNGAKGNQSQAMVVNVQCKYFKILRQIYVEFFYNINGILNFGCFRYACVLNLFYHL